MTPEMADLLRAHIRRGREFAAEQIERVEKVGKLHARAIFHDSLGYVPEPLKQDVQTVLDLKVRSEK